MLQWRMISEIHAQNTLDLRAEIHNLLAKGATELVPLEECGTGF